MHSMHAASRSRSGQVAVADRSLATGIVLAAMASLFGSYLFLSGAFSSDSAAEELEAVVHEVRYAARNHVGYDGLDTAYVVSMGHLAPSFLKGTAIAVPGGGIVTVSPIGSPATSFLLGVSPVNQRECVALASFPLDAAQVSVSVNGHAMTGVPTPGEVEADCRSSPGSSSVSWILR